MSATEKPLPAGLATRKAACHLLDEVLTRGHALDDAMARAAALDAFAPRDRAFAHRLAVTTLRRLGQIDSLLGARLTAGRLPGRAESVRNILRLGAAELGFLGTPAHAAIDSAVTLATRTPEARPYSGLVNAVLRRLARDMGAQADARGLVPVTLNAPAWLFDRWARAYGLDEAERIAAANAEDPFLDISVKSDPVAWAERLGGRCLPNGTVRRSFGGRIEDMPGFAEGAWWVQDAAAALVAGLLAVTPGTPVLDLCAAPGGKAAFLAAQGAEVLAVDRDAARLKRVAESLERLKLSVRTMTADILSLALPAPAARILLDAPCTATGTIRRHPDIAWLRRPEDIATLAARQITLLDAAAKLLAPEGLLVYAVCSIEPEEGPAVVTRFLGSNPAFSRVPLSAAENAVLAPFLTPEGDFRSLPSHWPECGGLDGFYAARLTRR